jgi:hypothetical protein
MTFILILLFFIKLFFLEFCIFSLFLPFSYSESGLVKLFELAHGFFDFFLLNFGFFY